MASIASKAQKQAGSSFSGVGDAAAKAITAPLDAAVKEAQGAAADAAKPIGRIGEAAAEAITKPVNAAVQAAKEAVKLTTAHCSRQKKAGKGIIWQRTISHKPPPSRRPKSRILTRSGIYLRSAWTAPASCSKSWI